MVLLQNRLLNIPHFRTRIRFHAYYRLLLGNQEHPVTTGRVSEVCTVRGTCNSDWSPLVCDYRVGASKENYFLQRGS